MSPFFSPAHLASITSNRSCAEKPSQNLPYREQYKTTKQIISFSSTKLPSKDQIPSFYLPGHICHLRANVTSHEFLLEWLNWFPLPVADADEENHLTNESPKDVIAFRLLELLRINVDFVKISLSALLWSLSKRRTFTTPPQTQSCRGTAKFQCSF